MKIHLRELTDHETDLAFSQADPWVAETVARLDETLSDHEIERPQIETKPRTTEVHFSLRKVDDVVVLSGHAQTHLQLICSRCAAYYEFNCSPRFSALFCKDKAMAGIAHLQKEGNEPAVPVGRNKGHARHAHDYRQDDAISAGQDLDITYTSEDHVDLADVLMEQLQLQIPFQPLCREECKGICANCGADMNAGRCACAKLTKSSPFSVLKDIKLS